MTRTQSWGVLRTPRALLVVVVVGVTLAGCAAAPLPFTPITPQLDTRFGEAVRRAKIAQTLDPGATQRNLGVTTTMDGASAANATVLYQDSFKAPPPTFTIFGAPVGAGGGK